MVLDEYSLLFSYIFIYFIDGLANKNNTKAANRMHDLFVALLVLWGGGRGGEEGAGRRGEGGGNGVCVCAYSP